MAGEAPAVEPSPELIDELTKRGVTLSTARELAGNLPRGTHPGEACLVRLAPGREGRPGAPKPGRVPGAVHPRELRPAPRLQAPKPRRPGPRRRSGRRPGIEEERERREAAEEERERLRLERVRAYWASLADAEQGSLWCKAVDAANPFFLKQYRDHEGKGNESEERWKELLLYPVLTAVLDAEEH